MTQEVTFGQYHYFGGEYGFVHDTNLREVSCEIFKKKGNQFYFNNGFCIREYEI